MDFNETFEEWLDRLKEALRIKGYSGSLDSESFRNDFDESADAYEVADAFLEELSDD